METKEVLLKSERCEGHRGSGDELDRVERQIVTVEREKLSDKGQTEYAEI